MAFIMNVEVLEGENTKIYRNAYLAVTNFNGSKNTACFDVGVFEDNTKEKKLLNFTYRFTPSVCDGSCNIIKQAYNYLKTREEYSNAIDC